MKTERDKHAELFADYMIEAMARTRLRQSEIARLTGLSRTTISQIVGKKPHSLTGKLLLPERETVDKIAKAFGDPISKARRAAGYAGGSDKDERKLAQDAERQAEAARRAALIKNFDQLSPEQQSQVLAIMEVLKSDHPELLEIMTPPIEIVDSDSLTESDAIEITGNTPP
jgi:transcriptional regulator with XRE-family HTH domain